MSLRLAPSSLKLVVLRANYEAVMTAKSATVADRDEHEKRFVSALREIERRLVKQDNASPHSLASAVLSLAQRLLTAPPTVRQYDINHLAFIVAALFSDPRLPSAKLAQHKRDEWMFAVRSAARSCLHDAFEGELTARRFWTELCNRGDWCTSSDDADQAIASKLVQHIVQRDAAALALIASFARAHLLSVRVVVGCVHRLQAEALADDDEPSSRAKTYHVERAYRLARSLSELHDASSQPADDALSALAQHALAALAELQAACPRTFAAAITAAPPSPPVKRDVEPPATAPAHVLAEQSSMLRGVWWRRHLIRLREDGYFARLVPRIVELVWRYLCHSSSTTTQHPDAVSSAGDDATQLAEQSPPVMLPPWSLALARALHSGAFHWSPASCATTSARCSSAADAQTVSSSPSPQTHCVRVQLRCAGGHCMELFQFALSSEHTCDWCSWAAVGGCDELRMRCIKCDEDVCLPCALSAWHTLPVTWLADADVTSVSISRTTIAVESTLLSLDATASPITASKVFRRCDVSTGDLRPVRITTRLLSSSSDASASVSRHSWPATGARALLFEGLLPRIDALFSSQDCLSTALEPRLSFGRVFLRAEHAPLHGTWFHSSRRLLTAPSPPPSAVPCVATPSPPSDAAAHDSASVSLCAHMAMPWRLAFTRHEHALDDPRVTVRPSELTTLPDGDLPVAALLTSFGPLERDFVVALLPPCVPVTLVQRDSLASVPVSAKPTAKSLSAGCWHEWWCSQHRQVLVQQGDGTRSYLCRTCENVVPPSHGQCLAAPSLDTSSVCASCLDRSKRTLATRSSVCTCANLRPVCVALPAMTADSFLVHSKLWLLQFRSCLRVVISSFNASNVQRGRYADVFWWADVRAQGGSAAVPSAATFGRHLTWFVQQLLRGAEPQHDYWTKALEAANWNSLGPDVHLVASVPNVGDMRVRAAYTPNTPRPPAVGGVRLAELLSARFSDSLWRTGADGDAARVDVQAWSVGGASPEWYRWFASILSGAGPPKSCSHHDCVAAAESLARTCRLVVNPHSRGRFHDEQMLTRGALFVDSASALPPHLAWHSKVAVRCAPLSGHGWLYAGSHNVSQASWGGPHSAPRNYELGVLLCSYPAHEHSGRVVRAASALDLRTLPLPFDRRALVPLASNAEIAVSATDNAGGDERGHVGAVRVLACVLAASDATAVTQLLCIVECGDDDDANVDSECTLDRRIAELSGFCVCAAALQWPLPTGCLLDGFVVRQRQSACTMVWIHHAFSPVN